MTARDRDPFGAPDRILSTLDSSDFDQLWLFAVDLGEGLTPEDCDAISRFRQRGGGLMVARDHMDLGCSVCTLGGVGAAHYFHTKNPDPDPARHRSDDRDTPSILWPNYHSGANGDFQEISIASPVHPVLADPEAAGERPWLLVAGLVTVLLGCGIGGNAYDRLPPNTPVVPAGLTGRLVMPREGALVALALTCLVRQS